VFNKSNYPQLIDLTSEPLTKWSYPFPLGNDYELSAISTHPNTFFQKMASSSSSSSGSPSLFVREISAKLADSKLFRNLPKSLPSNPSAKNVWFTFEKGYHAFALFNADDKLITRTDVQLTIKLSQEGNDDFTTEPASQLKGIYWYQCIRPTDSGTMRLEIGPLKPNNDIANLVWDIEVIGEKSPKKSNNRQAKSDESASTTSEVSTVSSSKKRKFRETPDAIEDAEDLLTSAATSLSSVECDTMTLQSDEEAVPLSALDIPPESYPRNDGIEPIRRLERIANPGSILLKDATLRLPMPHTLAIVLLDDRAHIQSIARCASASDRLRFGQSTYYVNTPTVYDLLNHFRAKCKISESNDVLTFLEASFEFYFESLLYVEEKEWLRQRIAEIKKKSDKSFVTSFGPIMLLRFIVFLSATVDTDFLFADSSPSAMSSSKAVALDDDDDESGGGIGDRKSASLLKLFKASSVKIHDVLLFVLKELDEMAHFIF
jgi:hypothetical protein